jgi:hypothetical protein
MQFARWWALAALLSSLSSQAGPVSVLIIPLEAGPGVEGDVAALITETVSADLQRSTGYSILTRKDVVTMLGVERQRELLGCSESTTCLTEIAGALNAQLLVHGTVGKLGDTWVFNLAVLEGQTGAVLRRHSSRRKGESAAVLLEEIPAAVHALFPEGLDLSDAGARNGVHWVFVTLRGNLGLPPQDVKSLTYFGSALAGVQLTPAWSIAVGGLVVRNGGAMLRGAWVPWNAGGAFKPVLGVEVPVLFGPAVQVGVALAPGFQAELTSWLSLGVDLPVTWFPTAAASVPSLYVFGAATATVRFL